MKHIADIFPILETPKNIVITTHYKPDADAIGSSLGLYHYLIQLGHTVQIISPSEIPDFLQWMPAIDTALNYESDTKASETTIATCDFIFCLDFNHPSRVRTMESVLTNATQPKGLIDHHLEPLQDFFAYGESNPNKSSTCEMVYDFIRLHKGEDNINQEIMQCLYAGCMTDTGSFRFPATTASVHEMIAFFKHKGLAHSDIHAAIYDSYSANRLRLMGHILNTIDLDEDAHFAIMSLSLLDAQKFDVQSGDTEGLVNLALSVKNIAVAIFATERFNKEVRISFRSKGNIDVSEFARTFFNGGGHFNAAGGVSHDGLEATINRIKTLIYTQKLTKNIK
jgi:phosphoesterase RecJ-like protein